jgi:hypothetical protein
MLLHLPHAHGAVAVAVAIVAKMATLPALLRRSLTWDQGIEMARHKEISIATDLDVYFCDSRSPWQRGTNENTNGLLRQYFPKGDRPVRPHRRRPSTPSPRNSTPVPTRPSTSAPQPKLWHHYSSQAATTNRKLLRPPVESVRRC